MHAMLTTYTHLLTQTKIRTYSFQKAQMISYLAQQSLELTKKQHFCCQRSRIKLNFQGNKQKQKKNFLRNLNQLEKTSLYNLKHLNITYLWSSFSKSN